MSADAHAATDLNTIFYKVNAAQHFEFPHSNCDTYTNDQLAALYFKQSGYGEFCARAIAAVCGGGSGGSRGAVDLTILQHNSQFVNYVAAWMRLKFVAEQVDPVRYSRYFERLPIPANKTPKLPAELLDLYKADSTEFYSFVDSLANKIQMQWIKMMMGWDGHSGTENMCECINTEFQTIRSDIPHCDPYELPIRLFLEFQQNLRRILVPVPVPAPCNRSS
jgi:hypothetical protein